MPEPNKSQSIHDAISEQISIQRDNGLVYPEAFEQTEPDPNGRVIMSISNARQYNWAREQLDPDHVYPVMVRDEPGHNKSRFVDIFYPTVKPDVFIVNQYSAIHEGEDLRSDGLLALKLSPELLDAYHEKYGK